MGDVVTVLDGFAMEEAEGGAFEGLGQCSGEDGKNGLRHEHGAGRVLALVIRINNCT